MRMENLENFNKNLEENTPFLAKNSQFLEKYKKGNQKYFDVLAMNENAGSKLILIAMMIDGRDSLAVPELNLLLSKHMTLENYKIALKPFMDLGIVFLTNKRLEGKLRQSFSVSYDKLKDYDNN